MKPIIKERLKGAVSGLIIGALVVSGGVFAKQKFETIEVEYNNIKVYKDNVLCELKDANGSTIEPFIYNGTTYMPIRGTANLADMQVTWDGATQSVYLWDEITPEDTPFIEECPPYDMDSCNMYLASKGDKFEMAGEKYSNGISFHGRGYALFNLNSRYSAIECTIGHTDSEQTAKSISFIVDGNTVQEVELQPECLPKKVIIPLKYGLQLKIQVNSGEGYTWDFGAIGIGNITVQ